MCECSLIVDKKTGEKIEIADEPHRFIYVRHGKEHILLEGIKMTGIINYAASYKISDMHGVKNGYMFIIGEK